MIANLPIWFGGLPHPQQQTRKHALCCSKRLYGLKVWPCAYNACPYIVFLTVLPAHASRSQCHLCFAQLTVPFDIDVEAHKYWRGRIWHCKYEAQSTKVHNFDAVWTQNIYLHGSFSMLKMHGDAVIGDADAHCHVCVSGHAIQARAK